jgi:hypothetical protein
MLAQFGKYLWFFRKISSSVSYIKEVTQFVIVNHFALNLSFTQFVIDKISQLVFNDKVAQFYFFK